MDNIYKFLCIVTEIWTELAGIGLKEVKRYWYRFCRMLLEEKRRHILRHKHNDPLYVLCPGPGSYNVFDYGLAQDSFKKAFFERTRKGGFGSTVQRNSIFLNKESIEAPSPGQYEVG